MTVELEKLKESIFQNLGTASMCWSEAPKGVFDSTLATQVGEQSMQAIQEYAKQIASLAWTKGFVARNDHDGLKSIEKTKEEFINSLFKEL